MSMSRDVAQMRIARELREAEHALDDALLKQSSLLSSIVSARRETGVDPFTAQDALMRLAKSQQTLLTAGGDLARAHGGLLSVAVEHGILHDCPDDREMGLASASEEAA